MYGRRRYLLVFYSNALYAHPVITIIATIIVIGLIIYACGQSFAPRDRHMHFDDKDKEE